MQMDTKLVVHHILSIELTYLLHKSVKKLIINANWVAK